MLRVTEKRMKIHCFAVDESIKLEREIVEISKSEYTFYPISAKLCTTCFPAYIYILKKKFL